MNGFNENLGGRYLQNSIMPSPIPSSSLLLGHGHNSRLFYLLLRLPLHWKNGRQQSVKHRPFPECTFYLGCLMHVSNGICLQKTLGAKFVGKKVCIEESCPSECLGPGFPCSKSFLWSNFWYTIFPLSYAHIVSVVGQIFSLQSHWWVSMCSHLQCMTRTAAVLVLRVSTGAN